MMWKASWRMIGGGGGQKTAACTMSMAEGRTTMTSRMMARMASGSVLKSPFWSRARKKRAVRQMPVGWRIAITWSAAAPAIRLADQMTHLGCRGR